MSTLILLAPTAGTPEGVVGFQVRLRDRLAARLHAARLDRQLVRGVAPETDAALLLRAERLISPSTRRALARDLRRVIRDARGGHAWLEARIPARKREIMEVADELDELASRLDMDAGPVAPRGVALVGMLLTDGCGPLYVTGAAGHLRAAVERAIEGLEPQV